MRLRYIVLLPLILVISACVVDATPTDQSYKQKLIEQYPFYKTATGRFAPIYPALARQIKDDFNITEGTCIDVGGGCGTLLFELAKITDLKFYVLDIDPWAVRLCNYLAGEKSMKRRVMAVQGDATDMLFRDNFADLIVSRGSIFFWDDQLAGVKECYRILKPGGRRIRWRGFLTHSGPADTKAPCKVES